MIRRLMTLSGESAGMRRAIVLYGAAAVCQGVVFALLVPLLRALLAEPVDRDAAGRWLAVFLAAALVWAVVYWLATAAGQAVSVRLGAQLMHRIGHRLVRLPLGWFDGGRAGWLSRTAAQAASSVAEVPSHTLDQVVTSLVTPATVVVVTFFLDWRVALAFLVTAPVAVLVFRWAGRVVRSALARVDDAGSEAAARVIEFAQAQPVLRAAGRGHETLDAALAEQRSAAAALNTRMVAPLATFLAVVQIGFTTVLLVGTWRMLGGEAEVPAMVALLVLAARFAEPLAALGDIAGALRLADGALDRVEVVLGAPTLPEPASGAVPVDTGVELDAVTFGYRPDRPVLHEVSLRVPAGTTTAIVGASGSGKTTVARLVARFYDVDAGAVRVGGVDVRDLPYQELADRLSMVFQDVYLFAGSIEDNVRLGRPDATPEQLREAARIARLDEVVERLPAGWATPVGEGGTALSGGERQRVSLARAVLKEAPIVLLDEATAAIDPENEAAVHDALATMTARAGTTVLVIAHRLHTVAGADRIVVLDRGRVVETGTHTDLLARHGPYARFWARRSRAHHWRITDPS